MLCGGRDLTRERLLSGEYPALVLWCTAGLLLLVRSVELLSIFVSLELLSVALYGLAAFHRRESVSIEAAIKYFLMGAFVSSFILYGTALIYGETGTTFLPRISDALATGSGSAGLVLLGFLTIFSFVLYFWFLAATLIVLSPFRSRPRVFLPGLALALGFVFGYFLVAPWGCSQSVTTDLETGVEDADGLARAGEDLLLVETLAHQRERLRRTIAEDLEDVVDVNALGHVP